MSESASTPPARLRFGVFEVDLRHGELRKHGRKVRLQEQPFQVLVSLLTRPGDVVTREELRSRLWTADTFVDFDHGLNKAINKIRDALGDSATSPRFVETVARRGYRFIAEVTPIETADDAGAGLSSSMNAPALATALATAMAASSRRGRSRWMWAAIGVLATLTLASVAFLAVGRDSGRTPSPIIRSLAVLPLESLSADASQDYFADGMTDELIATLGQISALRVISRTSVMVYKHVRKPLPEIARELNVDAVVEGTVVRARDQVRITAQLIDARTDRHIWSETYQGDVHDALTLQNTVARAIANRIQINVNPQEQARLATAKPVVPDAYEAYLKGRFFWNKRTAAGLTTARTYFEQAIARDPNYAQAYSGLADTMALLGDWQYAVMPAIEALPKAKAAATKALEIDDTLAEAHTSLAFCLDGFDWNFEAADREFRRGLELNPGYATGHHWYAWHLGLVGRTPEAIVEMKTAASLDPLSLIINADLAELLVIAHANTESIQQSRRAIELDPQFAFAHNQLGQAYLQEGRIDDAIAELRKATQAADSSPTSIANLARAYVAAGKRTEAEQLLATLRQRSTAASSSAVDIATIYAALGERDQAMDWLERGFHERFNPGVLIRPGLEPLRADARFRDLLHRVGLQR